MKSPPLDPLQLEATFPVAFRKVGVEVQSSALHHSTAQLGSLAIQFERHSNGALSRGPHKLLASLQPGASIYSAHMCARHGVSLHHRRCGFSLVQDRHLQPGNLLVGSDWDGETNFCNFPHEVSFSETVLCTLGCSITGACLKFDRLQGRTKVYD